jgi:hypothetical protein
MQYDQHVIAYYRVANAVMRMRVSFNEANKNLALLRRFPWLCPVSG